MSPSLSALSVAAPAEKLYRQILKTGPARLAELARAMGWPAQLAVDELQPLIAAGLVRETADGLVLAEHPRAPLERLLEKEQAGLDHRRRQLSEARMSISEFAADFRLGQVDRSASGLPAWETISVPTASGLMAQAHAVTTGLIRQSVCALDVGPGLDPEVRKRSHEVLTAGREQRSLYPSAALHDPSTRARLQEYAALGEQQRTTDHPPSDFVVFGTEAVFAAADWDDAHGEYVMIREPMLVAMFSAAFDYAWAQGTQVSDPADTRQDGDLLAQLARGHKDDTIARNLGWGVRTVRRRVARLMDELGVQTRFQLGVAVQQRELLGDEADRRR